MVFTTNDLSKWENFPKGLRVLLLDGAGGDSAADTRSKLQSMDYIVTVFTDENEALSAFSNKPESFHIAIVEVNTTDESKSFKFLEAAKDLPTIMTSSGDCLSMMMKCIALGAVEFLHKPLSEDKLKNIWQHVVHKAFNDGGSSVPESLKPVKESVVSMLHLELENRGVNEKSLGDREDTDMAMDEKDPAPSTPQLKQGLRLLDDGDCQENANCSMENANSSIERENVEDQDVGESKSVETTNCSFDDNRAVVKEEEEGETEDMKSDNTVFLSLHDKEDSVKDSCKSDHPVNEPSGIKNGSGNKANRKKVDWTPELHKKFVQAVEQLGIDQAIPSRILELMKVEGLTRHNVASHLQKFRMHRRNILPKEDHDRRWIQPRDHNHHFLRRQMQHSSYFRHRPIIAYPANLARPPMYPVWGLPGVHHPLSGPQVWPPSSYVPWKPPEGWHWKLPPHYPTMHGNAWGCPVGPPATGACHTSQNLNGGFGSSAGKDNGFKIPATNSFNHHPDDEVIDKVVKEAISKPWLPLPLGLRPPSAESVLAELSRQGISTVPSCATSNSHFG